MNEAEVWIGWKLVHDAIPTRAKVWELLAVLQKTYPDKTYRVVPAHRSLLTFNCDGFTIEEKSDERTR